MIDVHNKKDVKNNTPVSPIASGIAGMVIGGAAVAAAFVMSDKNNQKKVKNSLDSTKEKVKKYIKTIKSKAVISKNPKEIEGIVKNTIEKLSEKV